jgi:hypothetical protein
LTQQTECWPLQKNLAGSTVMTRSSFNPVRQFVYVYTSPRMAGRVCQLNHSRGLSITLQGYIGVIRPRWFDFWPPLGAILTLFTSFFPTDGQTGGNPQLQLAMAPKKRRKRHKPGAGSDSGTAGTSPSASSAESSDDEPGEAQPAGPGQDNGLGR